MHQTAYNFPDQHHQRALLHKVCKRSRLLLFECFNRKRDQEVGMCVCAVPCRAWERKAPAVGLRPCGGTPHALLILSLSKRLTALVGQVHSLVQIAAQQKCIGNKIPTDYLHLMTHMEKLAENARTYNFNDGPPILRWPQLVKICEKVRRRRRRAHLSRICGHNAWHSP